MKPQLIILLAAVTFTVAIPIQMEELKQPMASASSTAAGEGATSTSTSATLPFCKPETPCAWSIYVTKQKIIDTNITNSYCICEVGMECQYDEDNDNLSAFVHRCRSTNHKEDMMES